jgi:hypothetical protein
MKQVKARTFVAGLMVALLIGAGLGSYTTSRAELRRPVPLVGTPEAPILPVQMPLTTGTFAKVAEAIKPAVININTVSRGAEAARRAGRRSRSSSGRSSSAASSARPPSGSLSAAWAPGSSWIRAASP